MNRKAKALEFADAAYNVQITGRHLQITDAIKDYTIEKVSKIERFMNRIIDVNVIIDIQKLDHRVEIILKAGHVKIRSLASSTDMYVSIDQAVHKLEAQLLRYKSKLQDHHAKGHAVPDMPVSVWGREEMEDQVHIDDEVFKDQENRFRPHHLVKQEKRPLKTLSYEEAIMKMELSGDAFMIFKHESEGRLKIIYRRQDENYGIIEPDGS